MKRNISVILIVTIVIGIFGLSMNVVASCDKPNVDSNGYVIDEIIVYVDQLIDVDSYVNGETDNFFGVNVVAVEPLFEDEWIPAIIENLGNKFAYLITIPDSQSMEGALTILENHEHILSVSQNHYTETTYPDTDPDYIIGDVNLNGEIDSMDYILLKRAYFGTYDLDEFAEKAADVNDNGEIDTMDYILIKRAYFGTYTIQ